LMRIDSSGHVLVGTTSITAGVTSSSGKGIALRSEGYIFASIPNDAPLTINRQTSDGNIAQFRKDGITVGSIGVTASGASISLGGTGTANTLDDYEEGTWTPSIADGFNVGVTYSIQAGTYTKIGRHVFFTCRLEIGTGTANSGRVTIAGLPFFSATSPSGGFAGSAVFPYVNVNIVNSKTTNQPTMYVPQNSSVINFYWTNGDNFIGTELSVPTNADFYLTGNYITN